MVLIDWAGVVRNALWIVGLSVALASWSYMSWRARAQHLGLREALGHAAFRAPFSLGLLLFSAGLAWGATRTWERIAWLVLAAAFAGQAVAALREGRRAGSASSHGRDA